KKCLYLEIRATDPRYKDAVSKFFAEEYVAIDGSSSNSVDAIKKSVELQMESGFWNFLVASVELKLLRQRVEHGKEAAHHLRPRLFSDNFRACYMRGLKRIASQKESDIDTARSVINHFFF